MKIKYEAPEIDVKEFAQFENVYTACNKGGPGSGCVPISDEAAALLTPGDITPHSGGGGGGGGGGDPGGGGGGGGGGSGA